MFTWEVPCSEVLTCSEGWSSWSQTNVETRFSTESTWVREIQTWILQTQCIRFLSCQFWEFINSSEFPEYNQNICIGKQKTKTTECDIHLKRRPDPQEIHRSLLDYSCFSFCRKMSCKVLPILCNLTLIHHNLLSSINLISFPSQGACTHL